MSSKKYHVHGFGAASGQKLAVYMYDTLQEAMTRAKRIATASKLEATILKRAKDGRSYDDYIMVQPMINYRTFGIRRLVIRRKQPNGEWSFG